MQKFIQLNSHVTRVISRERTGRNPQSEGSNILGILGRSLPGA